MIIQFKDREGNTQTADVHDVSVLGKVTKLRITEYTDKGIDVMGYGGEAIVVKPRMSNHVVISTER